MLKGSVLRCIYCGGLASTRDHVPPRLLLEPPRPSNLQTVPCCRKCNHGFSLDEQYLLVLLAQIGISSSLVSKVEQGGEVDRTLTRAPALDERIFRSLETDEEGRILIKPEIARVQRIIQKIALGLYVLRYDRVPALSSMVPVGAYPFSISEGRPAPYFIATFTERFRAKRWTIAQPTIFSHIFVRDPRSSSRVWCVMDFHQTLWGVVHCPNPKSIKVRSDRQLWLASEAG
jgi:hypothetical protein